MQARNNVAKEVFNTDWAGKRPLRPVGVPLCLVPELRRHMPSGAAVLIDPPILQAKADTGTKPKTTRTQCKMKFLITTSERLSKVPQMNPRSKNSENTTAISARKKYGNNRTKHTKLQGKKTPACFGLRSREPEGHLRTARPRKPGRILSKTKRKSKRKETQQTTTNTTNHSLRAKPEGSAPRAPTHRSDGRPWVSHRNPSTTRHETKDLQHSRTNPAEKNQANTQKTIEQVKRTTAIQPGGRRQLKVRPPAG